MKKSTLIGGTTFLVLTLGLYFLFANSHIAIFPGLEYVYEYNVEMHLFGVNKLISLLEHSRGYDPTGDYAELTWIGYIVAFLVIVGIPAIVGRFVGRKFGKE